MTRGGTRTSAGGQVTGDARVKALGEALDPMIADLKTTHEKSKAAPGGKNANRKTAPKPPKTNNEIKQLQKDMKAFLIWF